jgi:Cu+-exporting ATPase
VDAIRLSRRTLGTIKANLFWPWRKTSRRCHWRRPGALSSCLVVSNSLRLTRFRGTAAHQPVLEHAA